MTGGLGCVRSGQVAANLCELGLQVRIDRVEGDRVVDRGADRSRSLLLGLRGCKLLFQVVDLVAGTHHVRVVVGVGQQQLAQVRLQLRDLGAVHVLARLHGRDLRLAAQRAAHRGGLRAELRRLHFRVFDLAAQDRNARAGIGDGAGRCVRVAGDVALQRVGGRDQFLVVLLDLAVHEIVGAGAFGLLGSEALGDEQACHVAGEVVNALGVGIVVADAQQQSVLRCLDVGMALEPVDQFVTFDRGQLGHVPAAVRKQLVQRILAEDHLARDVGAVGHLGSRRDAFGQRLDDVVFLDQDRGLGDELLGPEHAEHQCQQRDRREQGGQHHAAPAGFLQHRLGQGRDVERDAGGRRRGSLDCGQFVAHRS